MFFSLQGSYGVRMMSCVVHFIYGIGPLATVTSGGAGGSFGGDAVTVYGRRFSR